jgi:hypothetical protein
MSCAYQPQEPCLAIANAAISLSVHDAITGEKMVAGVSVSYWHLSDPDPLAVYPLTPVVDATGQNTGTWLVGGTAGLYELLVTANGYQPWSARIAVEEESRGCGVRNRKVDARLSPIVSG